MTDTTVMSSDFNMTSHNTTTTTTTPDNGNLHDLETLTQYIAAYYINRYYLYIITAVGLPGNLAAIVTLCSMKPITSSSVYMVVLAVVDALNIVVKILYLDLTKYDVQIGDAGCKSVYFLGTFLMHYSNWILVAMTIERFLAIALPLRVAELCTRRRAAIAVGVIGLLLICLDCHFIVSAFEGWDDFYKWNCEFNPDFLYFMTVVWYWIDGAAYSFLPFTLLLVFNTLIIVGIRKQQKRMASRVDKTKLTEKMKQQQQVCPELSFIFRSITSCIPIDNMKIK